MAGSISVDDVIKQIEDAATAATNPDEKALQIDYNALRDNIRKALGTRKVVLMHINRFLPEGYEDQGRFNALLLTGGKIVYDMVIGHVERAMLSSVMERANGNQTQAADMLGLNRNTLRAKLAKYGIR